MTTSPRVQGALFGYRWPLPAEQLKQAEFKTQGNGPLRITHLTPETPVFAVNDGDLTYHNDLDLYTLTRPSPAVGYEHWEYSGLKWAGLPPAKDKFRRVRAGDVIGFVRPGGFEFGVHGSTFRNPVGMRSYEQPFDRLKFYGASFTSAPELGEARFIIGAALILLVWKVLK